MDSEAAIKTQLINLKIGYLNIEKERFQPEAKKYIKMVKFLMKNYPGCSEFNEDRIIFVFYTVINVNNFEIYTLLLLLVQFGFELDDIVEQHKKGDFLEECYLIKCTSNYV